MIKSTDSLKNPHEAKYWLLIIKDESVHWKHCNDPKAFIWYFNEMDDIYENIEENIKKTDCICNITVDSLSNKILQPIVTDLFIIVEK